MNTGRIVEVSGPVVDCEFEPGSIPHIKEALSVEVHGKTRVMEVAQHIGGNTVRCIMLSESEDLVRGMPVTATRYQRSGRREYARTHVQRSRRPDRRGGEDIR